MCNVFFFNIFGVRVLTEALRAGPCGRSVCALSVRFGRGGSTGLNEDFDRRIVNIIATTAKRFGFQLQCKNKRGSFEPRGLLCVWLVTRGPPQFQFVRHACARECVCFWQATAYDLWIRTQITKSQESWHFPREFDGQTNRISSINPKNSHKPIETYSKYCTIAQQTYTYK